MGRTARRFRGRLVFLAALAAAFVVVSAPLAGAKPAPPTSTTDAAPPTTAEAKKAHPLAAPGTTTPPTTAPTSTTVAPVPEEQVATAAGSAVIVVPPGPGVPPPLGPTELPPPQPNPTITLTPSSGLQDQQAVQIDGTGFTPNTQVGAAQCRAGGTDATDCDINRSLITMTDADGNWSGSIVVGARMRVGGEIADCREEGACVIGAARFPDNQEIAGAPLAFAPDIVFPPPPVVTVDPATDLVHDQQVTLSGTGFAPGDRLYLQECADRAQQFPQCSVGVAPVRDLVVDDTGTVSTPFTVKRFFGYPGELLIDCADADCYLQLVSQTDPFATGRADLAFDPDAPVERPTASASPHRDLVHNQEVSLTGAGFAPFEDVQIAQCSVESDPYPVCSYPGVIISAGPFVPPVDGDGNLSTTFTVRRLIGYPGPGGTVVDCAEKPGCVIRISSYQDILHSVDVPFAFDPNVPLPPPPSVTVKPNRDLTHNQIVTVSGSGFVAGDFIRLYECFEAANGQQQSCSGSFGIGEPLVADADGGFTTSFMVKRILGYPGEQNPDCTKDGDCALYAQSYSDPFASGEVELHFDPDAPLPPRGTVTVDPSTGLPWRTSAHVTGSELAPNTQYTVVQCANGSTFFNFRCDFGPTVETDPDGKVETDVTVRRYLLAGGPGSFDCAPDNCFLALFSYDDAYSFGVVPLNFNPDAPPPPRPTLTVTPYDELADGTKVTVEGAGFSPDAIVAVSQCKGEDTPELRCDASIIQFARADAGGGFTTEYSVRPGILVTDGIVGCYDAPGACSLRAAAFGLPDEVSEPVPLTFGAKAPPGLGGRGGGDGAGPPPTDAPTPVRTVPAPRLAFTGTPVAGYLEFAAIFLGLGTLLVLAGRRRRLRL